MMEVKHHNIANQSQKSRNNKKLRTESNVKNTYKSKFEVEDNNVPTMISKFNFIIKLPTMLDSLPKQHATLTVVEQLSSAKMMDKRDPHYLF